MADKKNVCVVNRGSTPFFLLAYLQSPSRLLTYAGPIWWAGLRELSRRKRSPGSSGGVRSVVATVPPHCCVSCTRGSCRTCGGLYLQVGVTAWPTVACPGRLCMVVPTGRCNFSIPGIGQLYMYPLTGGCTCVHLHAYLLVQVCTPLYNNYLSQ